MIQYKNLLTGEQTEPIVPKRDYFELAITKWENEFSSGTAEGEFLCGFAFHSTFKEAWFEALTYTTVGGDAYQAHMQGNPIPIEPFDVTQSNDDGPADDQPFDPYAGRLDQLLGY